ncbi:MAG: hypothetical protein FWF88_02450 [Peptococcaceae bacterium]|nr:hypothetical protein [Peptococcaceae bacterium]
MKSKVFGFIAIFFLSCAIGCDGTVETDTSGDATEETNSYSTEALDINSELVQKLYSYIDAASIRDSLALSDYGENIYQSTKTTVDSLPNKYKLYSVFEQLEPKTYTVQEIEKQLCKMYGETASVIPESLYAYPNHEYNYKDGIYEFSSHQGGGGDPLLDWNQLISAESDGTSIYLYTNYACFSYDYDELTYNAYGSSDKKTSVASGMMEGAWGAPKDFDYTLAPTYKSTFAKASNGSYYWVSTEPVK